MEQIQKTTTKQTRNRVASEVSLCSTKFYLKFLRETGRKDISKKTYSLIINEVNRRAMLKVLDGRYNIKIPAFGLLKLTKGPNMVDYKKSRQYKMRIFYDNPHTNGETFHISFYQQWGTNTVLKLYKFRAMRNYQRLFAQKIFNNELPQL